MSGYLLDPTRGPVMTHPEETVRVIRDSRDSSQDYFLPKSAAEKLFDAGKLWMDLTNHCYATNPPPTEGRREVPSESAPVCAYCSSAQRNHGGTPVKMTSWDPDQVGLDLSPANENVMNRGREVSLHRECIWPWLDTHPARAISRF